MLERCCGWQGSPNAAEGHAESSNRNGHAQGQASCTRTSGSSLPHTRKEAWCTLLCQAMTHEPIKAVIHALHVLQHLQNARCLQCKPGTLSSCSEVPAAPPTPPTPPTCGAVQPGVGTGAAPQGLHSAIVPASGLGGAAAAGGIHLAPGAVWLLGVGGGARACTADRVLLRSLQH